jgi:hypothetical protein
MYLLARLGLDSDHHLVGAEPEQTTTILVLETTVSGPHFNFSTRLEAKRIALVNCKVGLSKGGLSNSLQCVCAFERCRPWCSSPSCFVCIVESRDPSINFGELLLVEKLLGQRSF